jgi:HK97 family phage major capsid protein
MDVNEIKSQLDAAVGPVMGAFEEFKKANDARLVEIEKKGAADVLFGEKLDKIDKTLNHYEGLNQKLTLAEKKNAAVEEKLAEFETMMARLPGFKKGAPFADDWKSRAGDWAKAVIRANAVGVVNLTADERKCLDDVQTEAKALNVSSDTAGGYLAPTEYVREIIKGVTEMSPARALVRVRSTANKAIQIPKRTGQFAARRVGEVETKTETTGLAYGLEEMSLPEMYALIDISNQMLEDAAFDMESEIRMEAEEQFAVKEGAEVISGTGVGQCEGVLTNADVSYTAQGEASDLTNGDALITLFHAIKTAYSRNATWGLNRLTLAKIRRIKESTGDYIWMPGLASGIPNTILGAPYVEMPDMPDVAANAFPVVFGDWRRAYTLADRISMEMLRDPYTQATGGNIRFIFRRRLGGQVVLAEAIRKLKIATS